MSLSSILPAPIHEQRLSKHSLEKPTSSTAIVAKLTAPPYGSRENWVPRRQEVTFFF